MPVAGNESVPGGAQRAHPRRAHGRRHESMKRVALNSHELGETLMSTEQLAVSIKEDLLTRLALGQPEVGEIRALPRSGF